jgi:hypothetical protein
MCVNHVQVHVYFPVLVKLMRSLLLRQKSQSLGNYLTSRHHTTVTGHFFKMF